MAAKALRVIASRTSRACIIDLLDLPGLECVFWTHESFLLAASVPLQNTKTDQLLVGRLHYWLRPTPSAHFR